MNCDRGCPLSLRCNRRSAGSSCRVSDRHFQILRNAQALEAAAPLRRQHRQGCGRVDPYGFGHLVSLALGRQGSPAGGLHVAQPIHLGSVPSGMRNPSGTRSAPTGVEYFLPDFLPVCRRTAAAEFVRPARVPMSGLSRYLFDMRTARSSGAGQVPGASATPPTVRRRPEPISGALCWRSAAAAWPPRTHDGKGRAAAVPAPPDRRTVRGLPGRRRY